MLRFRAHPDEAAFFREATPWGFILFRRNVDNPEQVRALCDSLRDTVGRADAPILIDQGRRPGPAHGTAALAEIPLRRHLWPAFMPTIRWSGARSRARGASDRPLTCARSGSRCDCLPGAGRSIAWRPRRDRRQCLRQDARARWRSWAGPPPRAYWPVACCRSIKHMPRPRPGGRRQPSGAARWSRRRARSWSGTISRPSAAHDMPSR